MAKNVNYQSIALQFFTETITKTLQTGTKTVKGEESETKNTASGFRHFRFCNTLHRIEQAN